MADTYIKRIAAFFIWPFRTIFIILKRFFIIIGFLFISVFLLISYGYYVDYDTKAHKLISGGNCSNLGLDFFQKIINQAGIESIECLDATKMANNTSRNVLLLLADNSDPSISATGHGYVSWLKYDPNLGGAIKVTQYSMIHWGPSSSNTPIWYTNFVKNNIPESWDPLVSRFVGALYQEGGYFASVVEASDPNGIPLSADFPNPAEVSDLLGSPKTMVAIFIDDLEFAKLTSLKVKMQDRKYSLLINDCTALVTEAVKTIGIYSPPRILFPFPATYVRKIGELNKI